MNEVNDFFTAESLLTFAGATTATFVVPNALQEALGFNPRWLALAVAELVCLAVVFSAHQAADASTLRPLSDYFIALINGCLVYTSAAGATSIGAKAVGESGHAGVARGPAGSATSEGTGMELRAPRRFFTPWF